MKCSKLKIVLLLLAVIFSSAMPSFAAKRKVPFYGRITGSNVNVRARPTKKAKAVYQLNNNNNEVEALLVTDVHHGRVGDWYKIEATVILYTEDISIDSTEGWIFGKYIAYDKPYDGAND